jgi:hypothetical protein
MLLRNLILKLRYTLSKKTFIALRRNPGYDNAKSIGLLIFNPNRDFNNGISQFVKGLIKDGKTIEALCISSKKNLIHFDFPCQYIPMKEIDWKGDFKGDRINKFAKTEFDLLYSINILPFLPFKIVLQKCKAKCRIGKYEKNADLDLMIQPDNGQNLNTLLEQMMIYSKKIKTDE